MFLVRYGGPAPSLATAFPPPVRPISLSFPCRHWEGQRLSICGGRAGLQLNPSSHWPCAEGHMALPGLAAAHSWSPPLQATMPGRQFPMSCLSGTHGFVKKIKKKKKRSLEPAVLCVLKRLVQAPKYPFSFCLAIADARPSLDRLRSDFSR